MLAMLKGLGLGAGAMYFFDPYAGAARRAQVMEQISGLGQELGGLISESRHDLEQRAGAWAEQAGEPFRQAVGDLDLSGYGPEAWPPAARLAAGAVGAVIGLKALRHMPMTTIALGAVGLALYAQNRIGGGQSAGRMYPGQEAGYPMEGQGAMKWGGGSSSHPDFARPPRGTESGELPGSVRSVVSDPGPTS